MRELRSTHYQNAPEITVFFSATHSARRFVAQVSLETDLRILATSDFVRLG